MGCYRRNCFMWSKRSQKLICWGVGGGLSATSELHVPLHPGFSASSPLLRTCPPPQSWSRTAPFPPPPPGRLYSAPARRSRRAACEEEEGEPPRSDALRIHSSPFAAECHPLPLSSAHSLLGGAWASGIVASHCFKQSTNTPTPSSPPGVKSSWYGGVFASPPPLFLVIIIIFLPECLHRGNLLPARKSGDVPEHVHTADGVGFTWKYAALLTPPEPPPRARSPGLPRFSLKREKGQTHRTARMGFYGTLKMIFYKVSRLSACVSPLAHPVVRHDWKLDALRRPHHLWRVSLAADCAASSEDEQQTPV